MHRLAVAATLALSLAACRASNNLAEVRRPEPEDRVEAWREDVSYFARELPRRHVAPFWKLPESEFRASIEELEARLPELTDDQVLLELARISASIGDGHTGFSLHAPHMGFVTGPLWLLTFADGVFVKGVAGEHEVDVLNRRLVRVGGVPIEEAIARIAPLIPRDNDGGIATMAPVYLNLPRVLFGLGLSDTPDAATYTFEGPAGEELELTCSVLQPGVPVQMAVRYDAGVEVAPPSTRLRTKRYGFERLGEHAYIQYNVCSDDPEESFRRFCTRVFKELDEDPPASIIVDLRWNPGGNSAVTNPLYTELKRRPDWTRDGRLKVLIGPATVSSGMWAAVDLARDHNAVLIGEPTGGAPNAPGEIDVLKLPNSKLSCGYSTKMWEKGGEEYTGNALEPDVLIVETSTQHFAGTDPVLEHALGLGNVESR